MTIPELAYYLSSIGMETAINLDGGGSTIYLCRLPGEQSVSVLNHLPANAERPVTNALAVISTEEQQNIEGCFIATAAYGSKYQSSVVLLHWCSVKL